MISSVRPLVLAARASASPFLSHLLCAALPPTFDPLDPAAYLDFVDAFGTHVPVELTMGGHATQLAVVGKANL